MQNGGDISKKDEINSSNFASEKRDENIMREVGEDMKALSLLMPTSEKYDATLSSNSNIRDQGIGLNKEEPKDQNDLTTTHDESSRFVAPKDFELLKVIGQGAFGKVIQVKNKKSGKIYAMKVISKRLLRKKVSYIENIQAERNILTKIRHPFIVSMHCSFQTKQKLFIVMEFCAGGELFLRLGREGVFLERTAAFYLAEIILALEHLHERGILHRDLKPENILLHLDGHLALTDFGLAKDFSSDMGNDDNSNHLEQNRVKTICGTTEYMAPEMIARKGYGKAADFWSLGCIAYEMMSGNPPFESKKGMKDLFRKILNERVKMPDGLSAAGCRLLKGLLNRDTTKRLGSSKGNMFVVGGVSELKQIDFFAGLDWRLLELKEIDPPESLISKNDTDMQHFHDEFLKMDLPHSVKEMAKEEFRPQRCASTTFPGFSFVLDDFDIPDRPDHEVDHYWNNIEADGQSLSTCASSVFDDEDVPQTPLKKKRPPRKKKKKIDKLQQLNKLESCQEQNTEKETVEAGEQTNQNNEHTSTDAIIKKQSEHDTNEISQKNTLVPTIIDSGISSEQNEKYEQPKVLDSSEEKKQIGGNTISNKYSSKKQNENVWQPVSKTAMPLRSPSNTLHKQHYSLSSNPYNVGVNTGTRPKIHIAKPNQSQQKIHRPSASSWAAHAASTKKSNRTIPPAKNTQNNLKHAEPKIVTQYTTPVRKSGIKELPYNSSSSRQSNTLPIVEGRPRIAVQQAFWPSLGESRTNKSQASGDINPIKSIQTKKKIPANNAWSKKR